jgi:branched-chain amino acid transport system substrate-binding protein
MIKKLKLSLAILLVLTSEAIAAPEKIKIGGIFALSGWAAIGGTAESTAVKMAIEDINSQECENCPKFELILEDNQSEFRQTAAAIQKLSHIDKVKFIIGPNWTEFSEVAAPLCNANKVVMLTASGFTKTMTLNRKFVFTTAPSHEVMVKPLSNQIIKENHKKIALITSVTSYFGGLSDGVRDQLKESKIELFSDENALPDQSDFKSYITRIKAAKIDAVIAMLSEGGTLANFLKQAKELQLSAKIYTSNAVLFDAIITKEPRIAEGATFFNLMTMATPDFLARFEKVYGSPASDSIPRAYDGMLLIAETYRACGDVDTATLADCLRKIDVRKQTGHITFDQNNMVKVEEKVSAAFIMKDGRPELIN